MKLHVLYSIFIFSMIGYTSCKHDPPYNGEDICFESQILPIFLSNCTSSGCHNSIDQAEGLNLTTYQGIMEEIKKYKPLESEIYEVITDHGDDMMPPPPRPPLTAGQIELIYNWIWSGAPNDEGCGQVLNCDTSNVTYSITVRGILNQHCTGCHNASVISGGVILTNYNDVKTQVDNGRLWAVIIHQAGYSPMPPSGMLDSCNIRQIENWISQGAPNN